MDADAYFAERGFALRVTERNLNHELPRKAPSRGSTHWADLVSLRTGKVFWAGYGSGMSVHEAKERARERYVQEQEPPEPERQSGGA